MRTLGFIFGFLLCLHSVWGQDNQIFRHLSLDQGMPDVSVFDIVKGPGGFMWFATKNGLVKYDGVEFVTYLHNPEDSTSLPESSIRSLYSDKRGNLWIGTRKGLSRYCPNKDHFERIGLHELSGEDLYIRDMSEDASGRLWLATSRGILLFNPENNATPVLLGTKDGLNHEQVNVLYTSRSGHIWIGTTTGLNRASVTESGIEIITCQTGENAADPYWIQSIQEDHTGKLWLGTRKHGLISVSKDGDLLTDNAGSAALIKQLQGHDIRDICLRKDGNMWIAAYGGLTFFNQQTGQITSFQHQDFVPTSLSNNALKSLFLDESETLWIGTYYGGVNVLSKGYNLFPHFEHETSTNSLNYNVVSSFAEDRRGNVWIGTEGGGLNFWDRSLGQFQAFQFEEVLLSQSNNIKALAMGTNQTLWLGTFQKGLFSFNTETKAFKAHPFLAQQGESEEERLQSVYALLAEEDTVWIGTYGQGLWFMDLTTEKEPQKIATTPHSTAQPESDNVRIILKDHAQRLWVGTGSGLYQLRRKQTFKLDQVLDNMEVFSMNEDKEGNLWIGTFEHGLIRYNPETREIRQFTMKQGLPNQSIYGVLSDAEGGIWISSPTGIAGMRAGDSTFQTYSMGEELPHSAYNLHAYLKLSNGNLLFGGIQGFTMFDPVEVNRYAMNDAVPLVLTGLTVRNHKIHVGDETGILSQTLDLIETLEFAYNEASFTIDFTLLNFVNPGKHQYAYKLEGLDNHWNLVSGRGKATYTIQNPGTYTLWIKGSTGQGSMEHERSIKIVVNPPIWKTSWAYLGYFCISLLLFVAIYHVLRERIRLKQQLFKDQVEIQKQEELTRTRQTFFTNVTHEFRTPLTLILGILEEMMLGKPDQEALIPRLRSIRQQSRRLLNLVTELMTLSKLESHYHQLEVESVNLVVAVSDTFDSFRQRAATQNIHYTFHQPQEGIPVWLDPDKFDKILFNLLSNAFKFTPSGGHIEVSVDATESTARVIVKDSGRGIKPEDLPKIFDRYYSTSRFESEGTGIGLSLTRQLVDMHRWDIHTESQVGKGTQFTITIPLGSAHFSGENMAKEVNPTHLPAMAPATHAEELPKKEATILVVEDHPEVRAFLCSILENSYEVLQANDGKMGLELAKDHQPDLILSDVMMPEVNGLDMCAQLKATPATSAIPVLLLSARHELEARVEGLQAGANDYLSKPFSPQELRLKIHNLLSSRQQLRDQSVRIINLEPKEMLLPKQDEIFLEQLIEAIEAHMWDPDYGVNQLSIDVGVSRPILFKKIKTLTDQTPKKFINLFRLRRAAQLLKDSDRSVSEIAYSVGFNDAKYFTRIFKEMFGTVPMEYGKVAEKG